MDCSEEFDGEVLNLVCDFGHSRRVSIDCHFGCACMNNDRVWIGRHLYLEFVYQDESIEHHSQTRASLYDRMHIYY